MKLPLDRMAGQVRRVRSRNAVQPIACRLEGNLDGCTRDGCITGWCWYPQSPERHVSLSVLVDDALVGTVQAVAFRPDLIAAGMGDGTYGFTFALPWSALEGKGLVSINMRNDATGMLLGLPIRLRLGPMSATEDRVAEMERQIRHLRAEIDELGASMNQRAATQPSCDLLAALGAVFTGMSQTAGNLAALDAHLPDLALRHAIIGLEARHAPFTLAVSPAPVATIVIPAGTDLGALHRCLFSLHASGIDEIADIIVLDHGHAPVALDLWPSLVRNLRIVRAAKGEPVWSDLARLGRAEIVVVLSPLLRPQPGWLAIMIDTFAREPKTALISGVVSDINGLQCHAGLLAGADGWPISCGFMQPANHQQWSCLREVDAVGALGFSIRRAAFVACGGIDPGLGLSHAILALCLHLRKAGHRIMVQPQAAFLCPEDADLMPLVADLTVESADTGAVRRAWLARPPSPGVLGHALVIDNSVPHPQHDAGSVATLDQIHILRSLGYHVTFAASEGIDADHPDALALEAIGVELIRLPSFASITDYLLHRGIRLDVVLIWRHTNVSLFLDRIRSLAPRARLIFAPADLHHLREQRRVSLNGKAGGEGVEQIRTNELRFAQAADATIVHSDAELDLLREADSTTRLRLLRWIARPDPASTPFTKRFGIGFLGSFAHGPNEDGLRWFLADIMPRLRVARPGLVLRIAGSNLSPAFADHLDVCSRSDVVIDGWVEDLPAWFSTLRLTIAPLRYGAGFKGKVATSLTFGVPVVGTTMAAEGTGLYDGDGIAIANGPAAIVTQIVKLHDNEDVWDAQAARAIERCRALYSPDAALSVYRGLLADLDLPFLAA